MSRITDLVARLRSEADYEAANTIYDLLIDNNAMRERLKELAREASDLRWEVYPDRMGQ